MTDYAALLGLDWGDQAHALALQVQGHTTIEKSNLRQRFGGRPIAIALEAKHGPLVHALLHVEFITLYPINPKTSALYRQAFSPSGAKDEVLIPGANYLLNGMNDNEDFFVSPGLTESGPSGDEHVVMESTPEPTTLGLLAFASAAALTCRYKKSSCG